MGIMVAKKKEPAGKLKAAAKTFKADAEKQGTKRSMLVQRNPYDKGIAVKKKAEAANPKPFGSTIGKK